MVVLYGRVTNVYVSIKPPQKSISARFQ